MVCIITTTNDLKEIIVMVVNSVLANRLKNTNSLDNLRGGPLEVGEGLDGNIFVEVFVFFAARIVEDLLFDQRGLARCFSFLFHLYIILFSEIHSDFIKLLKVGYNLRFISTPTHSTSRLC